MFNFLYKLQIIGFEEDVGTKTTFRVVAFNSKATRIAEFYQKERRWKISVTFWFPPEHGKRRVEDGFTLLENTPPNIHVFMWVEQNQRYFDNIWEEQLGLGSFLCTSQVKNIQY